MSYNAFVGGIQPGGLTNDFEVKILVCYLMDKLGVPMSFEQLNEILLGTGFVNYFEFAEAVSELSRTGHLTTTQSPDGTTLYQISDVGCATSRTFSKTLPLTVRERTLDCARQVIQLQKRLDEIQVRYRPAPDGYILSVKMKDVGTDLLNLNIFIPTEEECLAIRERIYRDPALVYQVVLTTLLGQYGDGAALLSAKLPAPEDGR